MHLCLIIPNLKAGGAERILSNLANYWINRGHNVTLLTMESSNQIPFYPLNSRIQLIQLNLDLDKKTSFSKYLVCNIKRLIKIRRTLKKMRPDIIISFLDLMNIMTLVASAGLKISVVISERTDPAFRTLPKIFNWLRSKTYLYAKNLVVQTQAAANFFPNNFSKIIKIIPNSIKLPEGTLDYAVSEVVTIISVGRLDSYKDHKTLILAYADLINQYPKLKLIIYGEGIERENLEKLLISLNLKEHVKLPGTVSNIYSALLQGDLFVFPTLYEGFPNALCEAMAVGLPVIASNCSGNLALIKDGINGRLFPMKDQKALIQLIKELLEDKNQRERLSFQAKIITQSYSPDVIYQQWDNLIYEIYQNKLGITQ